MNLRALQTMLALAEYRSFTAAAEVLGLSHSAVSLQVKGLEEELGIRLAERGRRPTVLTPQGLALVEEARGVLEGVERIRAIGSSDRLVGSLSVGVVPSVLSSLMPPGLAALRRTHPGLTLKVRSGLSAELALEVRSGSLDVAIVTEPDTPLDGMETETIGNEPLFVLAPKSAPERTAVDLLATQPFIWFSRRTWAGQQIERALIRDGVRVRAAMEVDSLDAIAALVEAGIGVAIAPARIGARPFGPGLRTVAFGDPQRQRRLVLISRRPNPRRPFAEVLLTQLRAIAAA